MRQYFGEVSLLLGVRRTASAKSKTQCMLYRIRKSNLLTLLHDYPTVESRMTRVAQSRRRRLAHYRNPKQVELDPADEIDHEDSQTELFGVDADKILHDKEQESNIERISSGRKPQKTIIQSPSDKRRHRQNGNSIAAKSARWLQKGGGQDSKAKDHA